MADVEMKRQRFVRIAEKRTTEVLKRLRILGNCSNRSAYEYGPDDVEKIFAAILRQVDATKGRFRDRGAKDMNFKL